MATSSFVLREREGAVATLTLNEPEARNPLSPGLVDGLTDALRDLEKDEDVRVVILTGAGRGFCAGADLRRMRAASPLEDRDEYDDILVLNKTLWNYPKPTIAAVHGFALGAGANLMSWCDLVVVDEQARVGYPEIRVGVPSATVVPTLLRTVGRKRMYELLLTGDPVDAQTAADLGLVNIVAPAGTALEQARALAGRLENHNPDAMRLMKHIVSVVGDLPFNESLEYAKDLRVIARLRKDFAVEIRQGGSADEGAAT